MIEDTLKRAEVFLGLDDSDLSKIASLPSSRREKYPEGHILFRARTEARDIYILEDGQLDLFVLVPRRSGEDPSRVVVDIVTKGSLFSWSALVKPHRYVLSGVCHQPCQLAVISGAELSDLCEREPVIGYRIFQGLSQIIGNRFRDLEQVVIEGKRWPFIEKRAGI
jgi:CRP/FNR family cyclic AMP-dependent transcriptional regulator